VTQLAHLLQVSNVETTLLQLEQVISVISSKKSSTSHQPHANVSSSRSKIKYRRPYDHTVIDRPSEHGIAVGHVLCPVTNHNSAIESNISDSILVGVFQQLDGLKFDMDRLQAGFLLLNQSMDRLSEVVCSDSGCCGWFFSINQSITFATPSRRVPKSNSYLVVNTSGDRDLE
jgi:hypothetical protein